MMKSLFLLPLYFLSQFALASASPNYPPDYNSFAHCLSNNNISNPDISQIVYTPDSPNFTNILNFYVRNLRFNQTTTHKPTQIVAPTTEAQVSAVVICAKQYNILLKIRSGGHDYEGLSYVTDSDFVILDLFNFRNISIDLADQSAWVGSGALLGELYYRIWEKNETLGFPAGVCPTVGVGGHFSGGGYGNMLRKYGLSIDNLIDFNIVVANGSIQNKSSSPDLFWAIRGGGGASFGIILSYKIKLVPVPKTVTVFHVEQYMSENASYTVDEYQKIMPDIDKNLFIRILLQPVTVKNTKTKTLRTTFIGMFLGNAGRLLNITNSKFPTLRLNESSCEEMSWIQSVLYWSNFNVSTTSPSALLNRTSKINFLKRKSDYVKCLIPVANITDIFNKMINISEVGLVFNSYGGFNNHIAEDATAFPHRAGNIFKIQYSANWNEEDKEEETKNINAAKELFKYMEPFVSKNPREAFLNYRDLDIGTNKNGTYDYGIKYFKNNFDRLVKVKTKVDPDNFFRNEQSIPTKSLLKKSRKRGLN
ncbi:hypothetical protein CASFOL_001572 [Castilleja foliolosa]|uniref:FAD-binding PCMH-type domain-containing protein n=1 Tax=Castilleja foliolosa TaxID=1961234 RepID=A0ABD3EJJ3_9LAMI